MFSFYLIRFPYASACCITLSQCDKHNKPNSESEKKREKKTMKAKEESALSKLKAS